MSELDPMQIGLRPATTEDREYLWRLHCATMREYVDQTWGWDEAWQRIRFDEGFDAPRLLIIEKDGEPIGCMGVRRSEEEIFLAVIEIAPEEQGKGVASQVIEKLLRESDQLNVPVTLQVLKVNPARRLYERLGFVCTNETATHYVMRREPTREGLV